MVQLESDPICNSAGCTQYKSPGKHPHPMNYFVPDFGMDSDVGDSLKNMKEAEKGAGREVIVPKKDKK